MMALELVDVQRGALSATRRTIAAMSTESLPSGGMRVTCDYAGCAAFAERATFGKDDGWLKVEPPGAVWPRDYCPDHRAFAE